MRSWIACAAVLLCSSAGCAYVPPLSHQYNAGDLKRLVLGQTTRDEAKRLLRSPQVLRSGDRILICEQRRHAGYFALVGEGGAGVAPFVTQRYRILLEFDSTEVLRRLEVEPQRSERGAIPGVVTTWAAFPSPSESLSVGSAWADPPRDFSHLASTRGGVLAAVDDRARLWVWSKQVKGPPFRVMLPHRGSIRAIALTPDGRHVASLSNDLAFVELPSWDFAPGGLNPLAASWTRRDVGAMALAPDGARVAVVEERGAIEVLDSRDGEVVASLENAQGRSMVALAWSPDGRRLAAVERDRQGYAFTLRTPAAPEEPSLTVSIGPHPGPVAAALAFSPDGRRVAINRGTHVELWSVADSSQGAPSARLVEAFLLPYASPGPVGVAPLSLSFAAGSTLLIAGNGGALAYALDGSQRRWRYSTREESQPFVLDLMVDPADGRLVGSTTRGLFAWDPSAADLATSTP